MRITFIIADTLTTMLRAIHEGEHSPYRKRTVTIELTESQKAQLALRKVGLSGGKPRYEEILECFEESDSKG